jgi:16S rRNA processing protein RimM
MTKTTNPPEDYVLLGRLGKTFQLAGGLRFYALGEAEAKAILELKQVFIAGVGKSDLREVRELGSSLIIYFTRALSIEAAKQLVNREVYAPLEALPEASAEAVYLASLPGLPVFLDNHAFGTVAEVQEAGFQYLLLVETASAEVIIPFPAPYVRLADDGVYLEDVPEGLLNLNP